MSTRLDLTGEALCEIGAVSYWVRTGKEPRWSAECEDVDWVVVVGDAKDETSFLMLLESLWCPESPWFSGGSLGRWELEGRHTLGLSRPTTLRGHRAPKLCRPGRVKCRLGSPCSLPWRMCRLVGSLRQRTAWVRFPEGAAILSDLGVFRPDRASAVKFLAPGRWVGMSRIPNLSRRWNISSVLLKSNLEWFPPCLRIWATAVLLSQ